MGGLHPDILADLSFWQTVWSDLLQVLFTALLVGIVAAGTVALFQQQMRIVVTTASGE